MEIRGIRGVNGVPGVRHVSPDDDDDEIETAECERCGEEFDAYSLNEQGLCEDCEIEHVWYGLHMLIEQQKRAGLREG